MSGIVWKQDGRDFMEADMRGFRATISDFGHTSPNHPRWKFEVIAPKRHAMCKAVTLAKGWSHSKEGAKNQAEHALAKHAAA